ncbi:MAG TPA: alpha-mannosidase, partial [Candidatus Hydrogenedentes bacterium]|nr:alpha-mannosidase [Candidatus Hydrogenedentota bacterium]
MAKQAKKRTAHIVSHTHWDREWRYPMWETRLMLIDFLDELIDVLESDKYPSFLLDGQVIPVLDYLEVRPEMRVRVEALVKAGKLLIGPWLLLPDEYPIDGEALVRNLLLGHRRAEALGGVFNVGYTSFGWGQTAQLPQIYAGFDIDVAMVGKRVCNERAPDSEFLWRAPDGTELLATRFGDLGRQNFYFVVHLSALFGIDHLGPDWVYRWSQGGIAYHRADTEQMEQDHFRLDAPDHWHRETITPEMIERAWKSTDDSLLDNDRLMMNGCDYTASQPMFPEMVERLNEVDPDPGRRWVHTSMTDFVALMKQKLDRAKLVVVEGELRDGPAGATTGNALTTRLYLKRLNKHAQNLLIRFAEPLSILSAMAGAPQQDALLAKAWQFLIESHPHDSVNGVTQDKTVADVENRLQQVIDLSQTLGNRAMQELVRRINLSAYAEDDVLLVVFNPLPYARREVLETWVTPPGASGAMDWPPPADEAQIFDADGRPVATQWQGCTDECY